MKHITYKELSRGNWGTSRGESHTIQELQLGALLRIADALEAMTPAGRVTARTTVRNERKRQADERCWREVCKWLRWVAHPIPRGISRERLSGWFCKVNGPDADFTVRDGWEKVLARPPQGMGKATCEKVSAWVQEQFCDEGGDS